MSFFKVTNNDGSSANAEGVAKVQYSLEKFVEAPEWLAIRGYHPLVFNSIRNAYKCYPASLRNGALTLWEVDVELPVLAIPGRLSQQGISDGFTNYLFSNTWPQGTLMFRRVRLKRVIGIGEILREMEV